jgi:hypothetical protein
MRPDFPRTPGSQICCLSTLMFLPYPLGSSQQSLLPKTFATAHLPLHACPGLQGTQRQLVRLRENNIHSQSIFPWAKERFLHSVFFFCDLSEVTEHRIKNVTKKDKDPQLGKGGSEGIRRENCGLLAHVTASCDCSWHASRHYCSHRALHLPQW